MAGYALKAIPSSSVVPTAAEHGKNIIMEGMLSVNHVPVRVLFDTGASRSFISSDLVSRLSLEPEIVSDSLVVYNPVGGSANLSTVCLGIELASQDYEFVCDLFSLGFMGYDIILGMD